MTWASAIGVNELIHQARRRQQADRVDGMALTQYLRDNMPEAKRAQVAVGFGMVAARIELPLWNWAALGMRHRRARQRAEQLLVRARPEVMDIKVVVR